MWKVFPMTWIRYDFLIHAKKEGVNHVLRAICETPSRVLADAMIDGAVAEWRDQGYEDFQVQEPHQHRLRKTKHGLYPAGDYVSANDPRTGEGEPIK